MTGWSTRQIAIAVLGLGAVAAVIASGVLGDSGRDSTGPVGSGLSTVVGTPGRDPADEATSSTSRTVITLGDLDAPPDLTKLGAPFDPCTVMGWADLPLEVRPTGDTAPSPLGPENGDAFAVGCRFDNSGEITTDGPAHTGATVNPFIVTIVWGITPAMSLNPSTDPTAMAMTFAGRPGIQRSGTDPQGHRICTGLMPVHSGMAGAIVTNARFPTTNPCVVAAAALDAIAKKVP